MAKLETPREISPIHRKGIEMAVRGLHKQFPFILGYRDDISTDQYNYAHYIDLIVDVEKLSEYTKRDINPHWDRELRIKNDFLTYALWSCLEYDEDLKKLTIVNSIQIVSSLTLSDDGLKMLVGGWSKTFLCDVYLKKNDKWVLVSA